MTQALTTAIRLLRDTAQELAEGISVNGVPDWQGEPETAAAYDEAMAAVAALEAHQAEYTTLQQGYDAARLEIDHLCGATKMIARWYMIDKNGMATLCTDREDAEQEAKDADMAWPHTAPHRAVQLIEVGAVATSITASAGSEPVAWRAQFDAWWARNRVSAHQVKNIGGFAAKVWHAAIQTVVGATDSTAGFYPADEGSTPSRQAIHPSPPEGMVMAPKEPTEAMKAAAVKYANGSAVYKNVKADVLRIEESIYGEVYEAMIAAAPPTTSAGSGKGE